MRLDDLRLGLDGLRNIRHGWRWLARRRRFGVILRPPKKRPVGMIEKLVAFFLGLATLVGAWFAFRRLQAEEVAERIDEARDVAQKRNVAAWKLIDLEVGKINAEITKVDDRDEIARLLDEEP